MENFAFYNPVKILFGKGQIANIGAEIPSDAKILITYGGGSIKANGVYEQVKAALVGRNFLEFGGIEANPHLETLLKAVELIRTEGIDFLIAVGGGSVVDGTKFIAAAVPFGCRSKRGCFPPDRDIVERCCGGRCHRSAGRSAAIEYRPCCVVAGQ